MRKLYSLLLLLSISSVSFAQGSFTISDHDPDVYVPADPSDFLVDYKNRVNNVTSNDIIAQVERTIIQRQTGHNLAVCWGITCTFDTSMTITIPSPYDTVLANNYNSTLKGQVYPQGNAGMSEVKYCVFDTANMADSACVTVMFDIFVGFNELNKTKGVVGQAYPNPSNTTTSFGYDLSPNIEKREVHLYNAAGILIDRDQLPYHNGVHRLRSSELEAGMYICTFIGDGEVIATRKFLVQ